MFRNSSSVLAVFCATCAVALVFAALPIPFDVQTGQRPLRGQSDVSPILKAASAQEISIVTAPLLTAPQGPDEVVAVRLQNLSGVAQSEGYLTFGQVFAEGDLPANSGFAAANVGGGSAIESQLDVKAYHADGSVRHGVVTLAAPALAAGASVEVMLSRAPAPAPAAPIDPQSVLDSNYDLTIDLALAAGGGATINAATLLATAVASGPVSTWLAGPLVSEFLVSEAIDEHLQVDFNIRAYADGSVMTDVVVRNDWTYTPGVTNVTYTATLSQGGQVVAQYVDLEHHRHATWHQEIWSAAPVDLFVVRDADYLIESGAVPSYDAAVGVQDSILQSSYDALLASDTMPMGSARVMTSMPTTGGRQDIGPLPTWAVHYIVTMDRRAEASLLANGNAGGSIPWHFRDKITDLAVTIDDYPGIWFDSRANVAWSGDDLLPDPYSTEGTGWTPDTAHQPSLAYLPYLITGSKYYLDELIAQATYNLGWANPDTPYRNGAEGLVIWQQTRGMAWALRTIANTAYIVPDSHLLKGYFNAKLANNLNAYIDIFVIGGRKDSAGELEGYFRNGSNRPNLAGQTSPWEDDYWSTAFQFINQRGYGLAATTLDWKANFAAGRFLAEDKGFALTAAVQDRIAVEHPDTRVPFTTWAESFQSLYPDGTPPVSFSRPDNPNSHTAWAKGALSSMISAGSPGAIEAYGKLIGQAPEILGTYATDPTWLIAPRVGPSRQRLLTSDHVIGTEFADDLIGGGRGEVVHGGPGDDTLTGLGGPDLIFGGDGFDTAVYPGNAAEYLITNVDGGHRVRSLTDPDDDDRLFDVERVRFDDQTMPLNASAPHVTITAPADASSYVAGDSIAFIGTANDPEQGDISGDLGWSSDLDGVVGDGSSFVMNTLSVGAHRITASATDDSGLEGSDTIDLTVDAASGIPVGAVSDTDVAPNQVSESAAGDTTAGITAFADDPDSADTVSYSLDDNAGGRFAIDALSGVVTVASGGLLDYEVATNHTITVKAISTDTSFSTADFIIDVGDANDTAPVITAGQSFPVAEDAAIGAAVGTALAIDADTVGVLQNWTISGGNAAGIFAIDGATGAITVAAVGLDYETATSHVLSLTVFDGVQTSAVETVTVTVNGGGGANSAQQGNIVTAPLLTEPQGLDEIVAVRLDNLSGVAQAAGYLTFGQVFAEGDLPADSGFAAASVGGGGAIESQLDVKAYHADGSVRHGVVTLAAPALAAGASVEVMLSRAPAPAPAAPVDPQTILASSYDLTIDLGLAAPTNAAALLATAVANGPVPTWLAGPLVSEFLVSAAIDEHLQVDFNIRAYADGSVMTDVVVRNDWTYTPGVTNVTYTATLSQGGQVVAQYVNLEHHRHATWHQEIWSATPVDLFVVRDADYLIESGAVPSYDAAVGVQDSILQSSYDALLASDTSPMGSAQVTTSMPTTGGRPDLGPLPTWAVEYIVTMDRRAEARLLANADAAGSTPWHFRDKVTGLAVSIDDHPGIWLDSRANAASSGDDLLPEPYTTAGTGWSPDTAHQPSLAYLPYLVTGSKYYLDELIAQATYNFGWASPRSEYRNGAEGLVIWQQTRGMAWALRTIANTAYIAPDGHPLKGYFNAKLANNLNAYIDIFVVGGRKDYAGELEGYFRNGSNQPSLAGRTSPWEDDYWSMVFQFINQRGYGLAATTLDWKANFAAGRFLAEDKGFALTAAVQDRIAVEHPDTREPFTTWAASFQSLYPDGTPPVSFSRPDNPNSHTAWAKGALSSMVSAGSPGAIEAYGKLIGQAPEILSNYADNPTWLIAPVIGRDRQRLLTGDHIPGTDLADVLVGGTRNELLHGRLGDDTLTGFGGDDLIFGGDGFDTAVYGGNASEYVVQPIAGGFMITALGPVTDGEDLLFGIEQASFADGMLPLDPNANTVPAVTITAPASDPNATAGDPITFMDVATDAEDDDTSLTASITWTSDLDGLIGAGGSHSSSTLSVGVHTITASVTDSGGLSGSDQITVTMGPDGPITLTIPLAAGTDDAEEKSNGSMTVTSLDLEMFNYDVGSPHQAVGVRFNGVNIPQGAGISNAYIQFAAAQANSIATVVTIEGQGVDDAPSFTTSLNDITSRARTTASVQWSPAPWIGGDAGPAQRTANVAPIIEELVNRAGWVQGNSLAFILSGAGERVATSYNTSPNAAPILHVEYMSEPAANTAPGVTITAPASDPNAIAGNPITFTGAATDAEDDDATLTAAIAWTSDPDGSIGIGGSFTTTTLSVGVHTITATVTDGGGLATAAQVTVTVNAANTAPGVTITAPASDPNGTAGDPITFTGAATDAEDDDTALTAAIAWTSDPDGSIGTGGSFTTSTLSVGVHTITATVTDGGGLATAAQVTVTVNAANTAPGVTITAPASDPNATAGDPITFTGAATDAEDDDTALTAAIAWTSDPDGSIGIGGSFTTSTLSVGVHTITATVTDGGGLAASAQVTVTVNAAPGPIQVCSPEGSCVNYPSLSQAAANVVSFGEIRLSPGTYSEGVKIDTANVTLRGLIGPNGERAIMQQAISGKAAIIANAANITVDGIECTGITVPDENGACIRIQGPDLTVRNVYFHDNEQGILNGVDAGHVLIEDSTFERNGKAGQAHGIYISTGAELIVRRTQFLCSKDQGHEIKTGMARVVIEDSVIDSQDCSDSRLIDAFNGGELIVLRSSLIEGTASANPDLIGYNYEARISYPINRIEIRDSAVTCQVTGYALNGALPDPQDIVWDNNTVTGDCQNVPAAPPVNEPPVANDDAYAANADTTLVITAPGVLGNDNDTDGDPLSAAVATGPSNGSVTLNADGGFSYTPNPGFTGADTYTYTANDGTTDSTPATVTITVAAAPTGNSSDLYVWDIVFESRTRGKGGAQHSERVTVTIHRDSDADGVAEATDAAAKNVQVMIELSDFVGIVDSAAGTTNGEGVFRSGSFGPLGDSSYMATVTVLGLDALNWNQALDAPDQQHGIPH